MGTPCRQEREESHLSVILGFEKARFPVFLLKDSRFDRLNSGISLCCAIEVKCVLFLGVFHIFEPCPHSFVYLTNATNLDTNAGHPHVAGFQCNG